jgi:hypothetical protein
LGRPPRGRGVPPRCSAAGAALHAWRSLGSCFLLPHPPGRRAHPGGAGAALEKMTCALRLCACFGHACCAAVAARSVPRVPSIWGARAAGLRIPHFIGTAYAGWRAPPPMSCKPVLKRARALLCVPGQGLLTTCLCRAVVGPERACVKRWQGCCWGFSNSFNKRALPHRAPPRGVPCATIAPPINTSVTAVSAVPQEASVPCVLVSLL